MSEAFSSVRKVQNIEAWRNAFEAQVNKTGRVGVSRLVYSAHLGLVEEAYRATETAHLEAGRNQHRHHGSRRLPHIAAVPGWNAQVAKRLALRTPVRAVRARRVLDGDGQVARLGRRSPPTISEPSARRCKASQKRISGCQQPDSETLTRVPL